MKPSPPSSTSAYYYDFLAIRTHTSQSFATSREVRTQRLGRNGRLVELKLDQHKFSGFSASTRKTTPDCKYNLGMPSQSFC